MFPSNHQMPLTDPSIENRGLEMGIQVLLPVLKF